MARWRRRAAALLLLRSLLLPGLLTRTSRCVRVCRGKVRLMQSRCYDAGAQQADLGVFGGLCEELETENNMWKDKKPYF